MDEVMAPWGYESKGAYNVHPQHKIHFRVQQERFRTNQPSVWRRRTVQSEASHHSFQPSRFYETSDLRDKVYIFIPFFNRPFMQIDYSRSVADVYQEFTQKFLEENKNLHLLHCFGTRRIRQDLPSWVPYPELSIIEHKV